MFGIDIIGTIRSIFPWLAVLESKLNAESTLIPLYNTTTTVRDASVTLFSLSAIGGSMKDIKTTFKLAADAAATFIVSVWKTSGDDLITFVQDQQKTWVLGGPAAVGQYSFDCGDLEAGLQMEVRIAQSNAGNATNLCVATLTYEG